jgi:lipoprotein NlpD
MMLSACASNQAYHAKGPGWYMVKPTDTLYSISWRYGLDYHDLARWNGLNDDYLIYPGQQLILIEPADLPQQQHPTQAQPAVQDTTLSTVKAETADNPPEQHAKINTRTEENAVTGWIWPTEGKVTSYFSFKDLDRRGIDIAGKIGQPVRAVAEGKVVYSGTGLAGYGNLIIIKHNDTFLSAYAYNRNRLVKEGMQVKQGTLIAEMGQDKDKLAVLHFQIRKNGKPVDPLLYLPKQ